MNDKNPAAICFAEQVTDAGFNANCSLPYGLETSHVKQSMSDFVEFLAFIDGQLHGREMPKLESFLMPANFSSMVGEFMHIGIEKHCSTLVKNRYHNGHPDLIPAGEFPGNSVQHSTKGIEIKASRYERGWQGHNAENCWLMVFVFDSNRPVDNENGSGHKPFIFKAVYGAQLIAADWNFSGRSGTSRRTITASVTRNGYEKMTANWIYRRDVQEQVGG